MHCNYNKISRHIKMKKILPALALASTIALTFFSCNKSETTDNKSTDSTALIDSAVTVTEVDMQVLSIARGYEMTFDTTRLKLAMVANVQWPTEIGSYKMKTLQDSIIAICFPFCENIDVKKAMFNYVTDLNQTGLVDDASAITPIDKVYPDSVNNFSMQLDARVLELTENLVTYQVVESSYLGGAHPNVASRTFTFDLAKDKILTISDLIAQHKIDDFKVAVSKQLAEQLEMTPAALDDMLLVKPFTISSTIYCADGYIYVHYNPYELLPYSFGTIDVQISPLENEGLLTPYAKELLLN